MKKKKQSATPEAVAAWMLSQLKEPLATLSQDQPAVDALDYSRTLRRISHHDRFATYATSSFFRRTP